MPIFSLLGGALALLLCCASQANTLRFVTKYNPPLVWVAGGHEVGPFVDILRATCAAIQATCTIDEVPWRRGLKLAEAGRYDGAFALVRSSERERAFYLSEPILASAYAFYGIRGSQFTYLVPQDLSGRTIVAYGPSGTASAVESALQGVANVDLQLEADNITVLKKLAAGRYGPNALAVVNRDTAWSLMRAQKITGVTQLGDFEPIFYTIGLSRKAVSAVTAERFFAALSALKKSGRIAAVLKKWRAQCPACGG